MEDSQCLIVGASHAAAELAVSLRQNGWVGGITMIGAELELPYHRPPLSKAYLTGEKGLQNILIRPASLYEKMDIQVRRGDRVESIDRSRKMVVTASGAEMYYTKLALTTGSRVRKINLPGSHLEGVFYLRELHDVDRIRQYAAKGGKAVIVGGGYIGLETAAALRKVGMEVTVLEALPRVLQRVTAPEVSAFFTRVHLEEGVRILTDTAIESIHGEGHVDSVRCKGGSRFDADLVIIGIGILPETELAEDAGLEVDDGIVVDEYARTSDNDIVAAGDCTYHYNLIYRRYLRLESVQNAVDQAKVAGLTLCGRLESHRSLPWFWSDQFDVKLQIAGLSQGYDSVVVRGDINNGRSFAAFYLRQGQLLAVDAINRPKEFMLSKRALVHGVAPSPEQLADDTVDIKKALMQ